MTVRQWILVVVLSAFATVVYAHDHQRPELDKWFGELKASGGGLCCSSNEGTVLKDVDWESKDGHYRVRLDGKWIDVPDDAVVKEPNLDGQTLVWPIQGYMGTTVRCFLPGAQG